MTGPRTSLPDGGRVTLSWRTAALFSAVVTGVGSAATAVVAGGVFLVLGVPAPDLWYPIGYGAAMALVATGLHIPWLVWRPPQSRWGVFGRAVGVGYAAVAVVSFVAGLVSVPWIAVQIPLIGLVVYTVTGAFLVSGAVAALCAPLLGPRLRRCRRPSAAASTGRPAPPP